MRYKKLYLLLSFLIVFSLVIGVQAAIHNVPGDYATIQAAIDAAAPGDTIEVEGGPYVEQLVINKNLNLVGIGNPIIEAPATRANREISGGDGRIYDWVVLLEDVDAFTFSGFYVNGKADGNSNRFTGILVGNSKGTISANEVVNIRGSEGGTSSIIIVGAQSDVTIENNQTSNFYKGGIVALLDAKATITGNTVTGDGPITTIAQNGIQVGFGTTGTITNNTIKGIYYDGTGSYHAAGIAVVQSSNVLIDANDIEACDAGISINANGQIIENITVADNYLTTNHTGIRVDWNGTISGQRIIEGNEFFDNYSGIVMFDGEGWTINKNSFNSNNLEGIALIDASVNNSILENTFTYNERGVYLEGSSAYGEPDNNIINNNYFSDNINYGVQVLGDNPNVVNATHNWWGHQSGPYHPVGNDQGLGDYVSDYVDFSDYKTSTDIYNVELDLYYLTIQDAIVDAEPGNTIEVAPGEYIEEGQIVIDKSISIQGEVAEKENTIIRPAQDTGGSGDDRGWFLVKPGNAFNLSNVTLDGEGKKVYQAIRSYGTGTIDNNVIRNMYYSSTLGYGIAAFADMTISNNTLTDIERVYVNVMDMSAFVPGASENVHVAITGNTIIGTNVLEGLQYGVEVMGGAKATISGNTIDGCGRKTGKWTSAGISVSEQFAVGTEAIINNNTFSNNSYGIYIVDTSTVTAEGNIFEENAMQVRATTDTNVDIEAILSANTFVRSVVVRDSDTGEIKALEVVPEEGDSFYVWDIFSSIQDATDAAESGDVVSAKAGTYLENITISKKLTLTGADRETTIIDGGGTGTVVMIEADGVEFSDFTVQNGEIGEEAGIAIAGASNCIIEDNIVKNNMFGIAVMATDSDANDNTIRGNIIRDNGLIAWVDDNGVDKVGEGNGIRIGSYEGSLFSAVGNIIEENHISGSRNGIQMGSSVSATIIKGNYIFDNWYIGLHLVRSDINEVDGNYLYNNGVIGLLPDNEVPDFYDSQEARNAAGIRISGGQDNLFTNNEVYNEAGTGGLQVKGFRLYDGGGINPTGNVINHNKIFGHTEGTSSYKYGIDNRGYDSLIPVDVDATLNWWGHESGPYHDDSNLEGLGDIVSDNVLFDPWIAAEDGIQVENVGLGDPEINIAIILGRAKINFRGVTVAGKVNVTFLNSDKYGPGAYGIPGDAAAVSKRVIIIETDAVFDEADLTFYTADIPEINVWDPKQVRVYKRSPAGEGNFTKVSWAANYDEGDGTITITVLDFSEFIFIHDTTSISDWLLY